MAQDAPPKPLPAYLPLPPGFALIDAKGRDLVVDLGHEAFDYQPAPNQSVKHVTVDGHTWIVAAHAAPAPAKRVDQGAVNALVRPLLAAQGWQVLAERPWIIARREKEGRVSWVRLEGNSEYLSIHLTEQATRARSLTLAPPGASLDELKPGSELSYVGKFPGSAFVKSLLIPDAVLEFRPAGSADGTWVGRPLWHAEYRGPADLSPFEFCLVYVEALEKAGWTIVKNTGGGTAGDAVVQAHFANGKRDIWLSFHAVHAAYEVSVADAGVSAEAKRLLDELDRLGHVAVYGIYFDSDSATIKPASEAALTQILRLLELAPSLKLGIEGHTDNAGARTHNQVLSEQRAAAVKQWLVAHKVADGRLTTAGFADTRPVMDNGSPQGRARNRRVELVKKR